MPRSIWTSQPQQPVGLNAGHAAYQGLTAWVATGPANRLSGFRERNATSETSPNGQIATSAGIGRKWTAAADAGMLFGTHQPITQSVGHTVLVVAAPVASGAVKGIAFSQRKGSGSFEQFQFGLNCNSAAGIISGQVSLYSYNGSFVAVSALSQIDGNPHVWCASNSTTAGYMYRDGVLQTLTVDTRLSGTYTNAAQITRIGNLADDTGTTTTVIDPLMLVLVWDRQLPTQLARDLSVNPWQVFAPIQRRIYLAASGGGSFQPAWAYQSTQILGSGTYYA